MTVPNFRVLYRDDGTVDVEGTLKRLVERDLRYALYHLGRTNIQELHVILDKDGDVLPGKLAINEQTGTSYTLVLTDGNGVLVDMNRATAQTLTVPTNASVAFGIGTQLLIRQKGAGQVTIAPATGVTLQSADGELKLRKQYSIAGLIKLAADTWAVFGDVVV